MVLFMHIVMSQFEPSLIIPLIHCFVRKYIFFHARFTELVYFRGNNCRKQFTVLTEFIDKFSNKLARKSRLTRGSYKCVKKVKKQEKIT